MKISVLGLGYIGLPTSIVLAKAGHNVQGFDVNKEVINCLNQGKIHIVENNLEEAYKNVYDSEKFKVYDVLQEADVYIISVPTPFKEISNKKEADLTYVKSATEMVAKVLKKGDLVILESTVPPGTTKMMTDILVSNSNLNRDEFYTAHCPERVLPGNILYELEHNDRIIGSEKEEAAQKTKKIYDSFVKEGCNYITDDVTAEMAKLVENSFRDINIAFANELSIICEQAGIDVYRLIELANKHPRVNILSPGVGVGGHCISVDPWFLVEKFPHLTNLIGTARKVNDNKPIYISNKVEEMIEGDKTKTIGILGLSYKPDIDDLRESPSIELAHDLIRKGYEVIGCEPNVDVCVVEGIKIKSIDDIIKEADCLVLTLAHKEFKTEEFKKQVSTKKLFNCVGI